MKKESLTTTTLCGHVTTNCGHSGEAVLSALLGNKTVEQVLYYLAINTSGYPRGIAAKLGVSLMAVQRQLNKLEKERIVLSSLVGRSRVYKISGAWPLKKELLALLDSAIKFQGRKEMSLKYSERKRPRRAGKPL